MPKPKLTTEQLRETTAWRNARLLLEYECDSLSDFCRKVGRQPGQLNAYVGINPKKAIGSITRRCIEKAFNLPSGWLEEKYQTEYRLAKEGERKQLKAQRTNHNGIKPSECKSYAEILRDIGLHMDAIQFSLLCLEAKAREIDLAKDVEAAEIRHTIKSVLDKAKSGCWLPLTSLVNDVFVKVARGEGKYIRSTTFRHLLELKNNPATPLDNISQINEILDAIPPDDMKRLVLEK